ncbi:hypothetical protein RJ55_03123 [Drechmeria coniospora]|nr:hypothetical protein RJ55_03123 [Drechmeria coniospora]
MSTICSALGRSFGRRPRPLFASLQAEASRAFSSTRRRRIMDTSGFTDDELVVHDGVGKVCARFPNSYWQERDASEKDPQEFHAALADAGWLGIALPPSLGGVGLGLSEATMMMQTIAESGAGMAGAQAIHANVYATQPLAKFGTHHQLRETIPDIISGRSRVCFGVTEPNAGLDTLRLTTAAHEVDGGYEISGQKVWITCAQVASKMILLARTRSLDEVPKPSEGLSLFCIDLDRRRPGLEMRRIRKMGGRAVDANEVFFDRYRVPSSALVGAKGAGFAVALAGINAERCLVAGEALGLGYAALERAAAAKYLAAEAAFTACERALLTHGGMGYAAAFDVERWFRESLVPRLAPVSREMVLNYVGERVLKLPRSY